jgi:hypothetical protein
MKNLTGYVCLLAMTAGVPVALANNVGAGAVSQPAVERELRDLRAEKKALMRDVATLGAAARMAHIGSWEMPTMTLTVARDRINRSGARLARLEARGESLTAAQKAAVSALTQELRPVAEQTEALISKLNENQNYVRSASYYTEVQTLVAAAERTSKTADKMVEVALNGGSSAPAGD